MSDRLAVEITHADGRQTRWGGDEPDAINIPLSLRFSTQLPGGFKDLTLTLGRRIDLEYPDLNLLDDVRVYGPGNQIAWEGRVAQLPRSHGDDFSVTVGCVGHAAHLRDDPSFREIYVDRDLGRWAGPSVQRRINYVADTRSPADANVQPDASTGQPSLVTEVRAPWTAANRALSEALYNAQGVELGSVYYAWKRGAHVGDADADWSWQVQTDSDDTFPSPADSGNLRAAGPGTGTLTANADDMFAMANLAYASSNATDGELCSLYWTCLAVYGRHGLTKRGGDDATTAQGFYASDVVADIIRRAAPNLRYTTGAGGSIEPTTFVIPHLAFLDPVTAEDALLAVNKYHLYEWGVYDDRLFFFRPADSTRLCWETRIDEGAHIDLEGDQADDVYNGIFVTYQHFDGTSKTVGPPGSGADATSTALQDTSADNPINAHGYRRRWAKIEISTPTDENGAIALGTVWLNELLLPARRGTIKLADTVRHPTISAPQPAWRPRAGDWIKITDHPADVPRRIIQTGYENESRTATIDVGNDIHKMDAIMERMGVGLVGVM
jgi:hypothetical protein